MKKLPIIVILLLAPAIWCKAGERMDNVRAGAVAISTASDDRVGTVILEAPDLVAEYAGAGAHIRSRSNRKGSWSVGGSLGATFGDNTGIRVAPQIAYTWGGIVTIGGGVSYSYLRYDYWGTDYSLNFIGANLLARVYVFRGFYLFAQPELYRRLDSIKDGPKGDRTFGCLLLGSGVSIPMGGNSSMNISAFYDVLQDEYTPYSNNVAIQVGFSFGL